MSWTIAMMAPQYFNMMHNDNSLSTLPSNNTCSERIILQSTSNNNNNNNNDIRKKRSWSLLAMEGLLLLGALGIMMVLAWSHAPAVVGLDAFFAPSSTMTAANAGRRLWRKAPLLLDTTTRQYSSNNSAEVSVLVDAELMMAQSPSLEFALQSVLKPALVDAVLAIVLHSLVGGVLPWGIFRTTASKWLAAASGRMRRHRLGALVKRWLQQQAHCGGGGKGGGIVVTALVRRTGSSTTKTRRLWDSSKRAVQHLYKKRARYSVASELTNLVPPEPKNGSKTTAVEE